ASRLDPSGNPGYGLAVSPRKGVHMKLGKIGLTGFAILLAVILFQSQAATKKGGTSILHFMVRATMSGTDADADATGSIRAKQNQQGNANHQCLQIVVAGLDSNATYSLLAATTVNTDPDGGVEVKYVKRTTATPVR